MQEFLDEKEEEYPLLPGSRHSNLLRLSQAAFRHGFGLGEVLSEALLRYQTPGFEAPEITRILEDAKGYADGKKEPGKEQKRVQKGSFSYRTFFHNEEESDQHQEADEELRRAAPTIPDHIFDNLPDILKKGIAITQTPHERDMLLLGMITTLSGCLPRVTFTYRKKSLLHPSLLLCSSPRGNRKRHPGLVLPAGPPFA
ncbi:MAG: hypothetical protein LUE93_04990 [Bacteroides sp.]|nr:hypothetical protein [Bacteroides sp.]